MRVPTKGIALMGNRYEYGGVTLDRDNKLYIVINSVNKLVCYDLASDAILWSMNALGYAKFCEVESICWMEDADYTPHIIMLLANGEIWDKVIASGFTETLWGDPSSDFPEGRGADGIEYQGGTLVVTYPQFNVIRRLALRTLLPVSEAPTGVPSDSPYPPSSISWDGVNDRFVCVDPVKGDLVYLNTATFHETGRERYTFGIYGDCFRGDLAWSKAPLLTQPGVDFFVACQEKMCLMYGEAWYKLYQGDDTTGVWVEIEAIVLDNVEVGSNNIRHLRLENMTSNIKNAVTISVADDPALQADDATWVGPSAAGPWSKSIELGDVSGTSVMDFYVRFAPAYGIELGFFTVNLVVDYTKLP